MWGGISAYGRTPLVTINGNLNAHHNMEEVVRPHVMPFVRGQRRNMTFQQDNARPHVARLIMNLLRHGNVLVIDWPSMSPDLSPIEHVWDKMDRRLRQRTTQPVTLQRLSKALQEVWQKNPANIPYQTSGINEALVSGMCQCARWLHTLLAV